MTLGISAGLFFAVFAATFAVTKIVLSELQQRSLLDLPNDRSSHSTPTPRGGGLAILAVILPVLLLLAMAGQIPQQQTSTLCFLTFLLAAICWTDDLRGLSPILRLAAHLAAVGVAIMLGLIDGPVFGGLLPPVLDKIAAGIVWIWFINLFNFMDGIDGIAGIETATVGIGIALLATLTGLGGGLGYIAVVLAGAATGFLIWNWHPARIFLGDVGSVPIGFLLGWLLLSITAEGYWAAALILPAYFLIDATVTLLRRMLRGERVWQAHREHFYQYAVQHGKSHAEVSCAVGLANGCLVILAVLALPDFEYWTIVAALGVTTFLIFWMLRSARNSPTDGRAE